MHMLVAQTVDLHADCAVQSADCATQQIVQNIHSVTAGARVNLGCNVYRLPHCTLLHVIGVLVYSVFNGWFSSLSLWRDCFM